MSNNHIVIMAGGVGSRFWPLSTPEYPKQFIDILGCGRTLIQLTVDRLQNYEKSYYYWLGGYAKSVLDSVDYMNFKMVGYIDDIKPKGTMHQGYPVLGGEIDCLDNPSDNVYFIAIGNNAKRKAWFDKLKERNLSLINVIDKSALVSKASTIGEGSFIGKLAILNHGCSVGDNCVINTRALIEHGCQIKDHVNVSTNATLNGDVICEEGSFVGSGTVINGQLTIGEWALVGSGAVVIKDVPAKKTVVGVPAKEIESNNRKYN